MDSDPEDRTIATDNYKINKFDSTDFSTKLVTVHTSFNDLDFKSISPQSEEYVENKTSGGAKLLDKLEYNKLKNSTTSFTKWSSQTSLLDDLVDEDSALNKNDSDTTNYDSDGGLSVKEEDDDRFDFLFDKSDAGRTSNNPVLTFLLNNFSKLEANRPLSLRDGMANDFKRFKNEFMIVSESNVNELKLKKALLSVAFNHYGCSTMAKYMTHNEYLNLLNTHQVFTNSATAKLVFDSMDRKHKTMVTMNEFVSGMLSCSPDAKHTLSTAFGRLRLQHIFRAYDSKRLGYLDRESVDLMQTHLEQLAGNRLNYDQKVNEKLLESFNGKLSYDSFFYCVENNLLKNTTLIFRSSYDLADVFKNYILKALKSVDDNALNYISPVNKPSSSTDYARSFENNKELFHHGNTPRSPYRGFSSPEGRPSSVGSGINRSSIWSHTPRVYSEFTHNITPPRDNPYGYNFDNKWAKSSDTSPKPSYENPIDRISKIYNEQAHEEDVVDKYNQNPVGSELKEEMYVTPVKVEEPKQVSTGNTESAYQKYKMSEQPAKIEAETEIPPKDKASSGADYKVPEETTPSRFDKIDEFLREYEQSYKSPKSDSRSQSPPVFTNLDSFKDAVEDESQMVDDYKDQSAVFKSFDTVADLLSEEQKFNNLAFRDSKLDRPVDNSVIGEKSDGPSALVDSLNEKLKIYDYNFDKDLTTATFGHLDEKEEVKQTARPNKDEDDDLERTPEAKHPSVATETKSLDESSIDALTQHLSKKYTYKFLVIKGHLIDDSVAKEVFKNFLAHSLGESTDHSSLRLCTYSDMLQLCDSVCSILKREDSLLSLTGDIQVFASLNGDLSCLLDMFNAYGWPMMKSRWFEHAGVDFKGIVHFDYSYLFMGGFVSEFGPFSLEFVLLMFALKVLFPYHVHFVRSSKDERRTTNNAGFYHQIYTKLSENHAALRLENDETLLLQCSKELFHRINDVFEYMAVGAVLNEEVLCVDKLTSRFSYVKLGFIKKPLNISTCVNEQVYDLLFNKSYFSFPSCRCTPSPARSSSPGSSERRLASGSISPISVVSEGKAPSISDSGASINLVITRADCSKSPSDGCRSPLSNFSGARRACSNVTWELGDAEGFRMVICSSDELESGFTYLLNNKLLLLSTNFLMKGGEKVASCVIVTENKVTHRSLKLD